MDSQNVEDPFTLSCNPIEKFAMSSQPRELLSHMVGALEIENAKLSSSLTSTLKTLEICINCGNQDAGEVDVACLTLSNEREEFSSSLSVTLKVIYIFEGD